MMRFACGLGLAVLVLGLVGAPLRADDEEKEPGGASGAETPSPLAELRAEDLTQDAEPADPLAYLRSFRDWIARHEEAPSYTREERTVYDVWRAVLKPRAARMRRRVETMLERRYWAPDIGLPTHVKREHWSRVIRQLAGLNAALLGAWRQYDRVQIRERRLVRPPTRFYGYVGYAFPASRWRAALYGRQSVGLGAYELRSYWNLMNRYRRGWGWRVGVCHRCIEYERARQEKHEEEIEEKRRAIETTRDTLEQQMMALQVLAGAMQAMEEHALHERIEDLPEDHLLREPAERVLASMREARLAAERYSGDSSATYGGLLRDWLRAYKGGTKLLEAEAERLDDESDDESDDDGR